VLSEVAELVAAPLLAMSSTGQESNLALVAIKLIVLQVTTAKS
jgi:hypothetical protein